MTAATSCCRLLTVFINGVYKIYHWECKWHKSSENPDINTLSRKNVFSVYAVIVDDKKITNPWSIVHFVKKDLLMSHEKAWIWFNALKCWNHSWRKRKNKKMLRLYIKQMVQTQNISTVYVAMLSAKVIEFPCHSSIHSITTKPVRQTPLNHLR